MRAACTRASAISDARARALLRPTHHHRRLNIVLVITIFFGDSRRARARADDAGMC